MNWRAFLTKYSLALRTAGAPFAALSQCVAISLLVTLSITVSVGGMACGVPAHLTPATAPRPQAVPFSMGPYLLALPADEFAVVMELDDVEPPVVEWWAEVAESATSTMVSVPAELRDGLWVAVLTELPKQAIIHYRVRVAGKVTAERPVVTRPAVDTAFRFAAFGDTRTGHKVHQAVVDAVAREKADFILHTGDMVERGGEDEQWQRFFEIERELIATRPIIATVGNHDDSPRQHYRRLFLSALMHDNERFFAVDWGNLRVVSIDPLEECRDGCSQFLYVDQVLEDAAARGMLVVMMVHYPPYSSGAHGSYVDIREIVSELAVRHGVELVISGHDHNYERTHPIDGVTYVVTGSAGAPIKAVSPQPFTAAIRTEPHFIIFDVDDTGIGLRAINLHGETFDFHHIAPLAPRAPPK